ncbi:ATP-binding cassette domain-containing protein [Treponema pedis]|uniref:ABC transporter ATP-binding protein n=1 Tax=Treponema pedis TaxID=409322 RepID=A0A7S7AVM2_9SPIR|nr:ABC transporter ATP-binding protein [Treponema pedis]QOW60350.1 ABC transporter ATP-binding protein [Treponema pedis]
MKGNKEKTTLKNLLVYFFTHNFKLMSTAFASYLLLNLASYFLPAWINKQLFSFLEGRIQLPLGIWIVVIFLFSNFLILLLGQFINALYGEKLRVYIRNYLADKMLSAILYRPKAFKLEESAGETSYKFREDPLNFCYFIADINSLTASLIISSAALAAMFSMNIMFTIVSIIIIIVNVICLTFLLPLLEKYYEDLLKLKSKSSGFLTASIYAIQEIKTNNKLDSFIEAYSETNKKTGKASVKEKAAGKASESLYKIGHELFTVFLILFYAFNLNKINFSTGDFAFFMGLSVSFSSFSYSIAQFLVSRKQLNVSLRRISDISDNYTQHSSVKLPLDFKNIEIKNLRIEYPASNFKIEKSLSINKGDYLLIKGAVASGKTSFIKAVLGLQEFTGGEIFIDNKKIDTLEEIFKAPFVMYVPSSPQIFNMSLKENLCMGIDKIESNNDILYSIEQAIKITSLERDVQNMSEKLETIVGNYSGGVSGGQAQRIGIARALCCNPKLLVLDDCFTAIDKIIANEIREKISQIPDLTVVEFVNTDVKAEFVKDIVF